MLYLLCQQEVDRYRTAMRKMATDLLHVREDCKRLEVCTRMRTLLVT